MVETPTPLPIWLVRNTPESYSAPPEPICWLIRSPKSNSERR